MGSHRTHGLRGWSVKQISITILITILMIGVGCAPANSKKTLASLEKKPVTVAVDKDTSVDHAREKAMRIYKEFDQTGTDPCLRLEAKRRLADLEMEKGEDRNLRSGPAARNLDQDPSELKKDSYGNAIKLYKELLANAKDGPNSDRILYQLAKAYESSGDLENALQTLNQLARNYPDLGYQDEVNFRRGELAFVLEDYNLADEAYGKVLAMGEFSQFYEKALYKRGWAEFKLSRYDPALTAFFRLLDRKLVDASEMVAGVKLGETTPAKNSKAPQISRGEEELIRDTFRVVNLSLSYLDSGDTIKAYFDRNGHRNYEYLIYENLGNFYLSQDRVQDAAQVFKSFAQYYPDNSRAPQAYLNMMKAYKQGGYEDLLFQAKQAFVERYALDGKYWRSFDEATRGQILPFLRANMQDVAKHYHARAQKSKRDQDYERAITWYQSYIKTFAKDESVPEMNFMLAEALFETGRYQDAVTEYEKTAYNYHTFAKSAEAGYAALLAYAKQEATLQGKEKDSWHRLAIGSSLRFGKVYAQDKRAAEVVVKVAEDLFAMKKLDQAAQAARQVLELKPEASQEARLSAWNMIAYAALEKEDFVEAEVSYKVALSLLPQNSPRQAEFKEGLAAAIYKQGEQLRKNGDVQQAIAQFARIKDVAPNSDVNVAAAFDVAVSFIQTEKWAEAVTAFGNFRQKYPQHELVADATQNMVMAYVKLNKMENAAQELERLSSYKKDPEFKRQALLQMGEMYEKAGNTDKVLTTYKQYVALYPNPLDKAVDLRQKVAEIYKTRGAQTDYLYWLREIVVAQQNSSDQSTQHATVVAAKAAYTLALPAYDAFQQVQLVVPLKTSLQQKKSKMKDALDALKKAADYGVPEVTTAATYHIAQVYSDLAQGMLHSDRPDGLSSEELEQYQMLLEEQAFPFEEKAIQIHESNAGLAAKGVYDEWVKKSFAALTILHPVRYAKTERIENYIDVVQ